jgi:hypothetical protein
MRAHPIIVKRLLGAAAMLLMGGAAAATACIDINTDPTSVASIALDTVAAPFILDGDSLRDTLGVARPLHATAYNPKGAALGIPIVFRSADLGVHVDSLTGYVTADSARPTPIRIVAQAGGLQTVPDSLFVVPPPDSVVAVNAADSLLYSLKDSTLNVSSPLRVKVLHRKTNAPADIVRGYLVSYAITYPSDTLLAQLVGLDGHPSRVDTTKSDGTAGRRVRVRPLHLTAATDSVVVLAMIRVRGVPVTGAPLRFVLQVRPRQ